MSESEIIITAARRYCLNLIDRALSTQSAIATGLLHGVEYLTGKEFPDPEECKAELKDLGQNSLMIETKRFYKQGHIKQIEREKQRFIQFIDSFDVKLISEVKPLGFRRHLSENESKLIRAELKTVWNFDCWTSPNYYWEPLCDNCSPKPFIYLDHDLKDTEVQKIKLALSRVTQPFGRIYELTEEEIDYEVEVSQFHLENWESVYTSAGCDWIIYISHEGTVAFGGTELIKQIKIFFPSANIKKGTGDD